jgi:hypothetical protein
VNRPTQPPRTRWRTSFTKSDEKAGTRGPCKSAMHTARYDAVHLRRLRSFWPVMAE